MASWGQIMTEVMVRGVRLPQGEAEEAPGGPSNPGR